MPKEKGITWTQDMLTNPILCASLILEQEGFGVLGEAWDGREAVDLATALHPDIAVLDVAMPDLNGIEAARQITEVVSRCGFRISNTIGE